MRMIFCLHIRRCLSYKSSTQHNATFRNTTLLEDMRMPFICKVTLDVLRASALDDIFSDAYGIYLVGQYARNGVVRLPDSPMDWKKGLCVRTHYRSIKQGTAIATFNTGGKFEALWGDHDPERCYAAFFHSVADGCIEVVRMDPGMSHYIVSRKIILKTEEAESLHTIENQETAQAVFKWDLGRF